MATAPTPLGFTFSAADTGSYAGFSQSEGLPPGLQRVTAVQTIRLTGASTGTFTLYWRGETTAPIAWNASAAAVDAALEALTGIPANGVTVTGSAGNWVVTFTNMPGPQTPIYIDDLNTDGTGSVEQTTQGVADFLVWVVVLGATTISSVPAGWTQKAFVQRSPDPSNVYVFTKFWMPGDDNTPDITLTSGGSGRHYATMLAFRGVDPNDAVNAVATNYNHTTNQNLYVLPQISTFRDDSLVVFATGTSRNSSHSFSWSGATERSDNVYAPASAYTPGGLFTAATQGWYSLTTASLVKSAAGSVPVGSVYAQASGGSASPYWFGAALALSPVPDAPPPPAAPPEHPDCVSANFANGTQLAWGRPVQGVYFDQAVLGGVVSFTTPGAPGTLMYDQNIIWFNDTGLPLLVTPVFVHGSKQVYVLDPIQAYIDEYWAMTSGLSPATPTLPGTESNKFGGGTDSGEPCVFQYLEEDLMRHEPFGQITVPNGHSIKINYQCRLSTVGSSASSATASQWAQCGSHRIVLLGEVVPDPALP
ncbi:DUF7172 family protein [Rhodococcus koreensis]